MRTDLRRIGLLLLTGFLFAAGTVCAGETGTARKPSELKSEPYRDAETLGTLAPGDKVEIVTALRGWFSVRSAKGSGWVRMLDIRRGQARPGIADRDELFALASGRAGTGQVVASTGIRGLGEEELKAAAFDEAELKKLDSYQTSQAAAEKFASRGGLKARVVD